MGSLDLSPRHQLPTFQGLGTLEKHSPLVLRWDNSVLATDEW